MFLLTNDKVLDLARRPEVVNRWPFLKAVVAAAPPADCPSCQRKKYEAGFRKAAESAKGLIAQFDRESADNLRSLIGLPPGTPIRVFFLNNGKTDDKQI